MNLGGIPEVPAFAHLVTARLGQSEAEMREYWSEVSPDPALWGLVSDQMRRGREVGGSAL
jgi:hypothetical protein